MAKATPATRRDATLRKQSSGRTNFGDMMQHCGSSPLISSELQEKLRDTMWMNGDPFYRVVLTANANLQMIMSAWYNSKVDVKVMKNELCGSTTDWDPPHLRQYDRVVQISTGGDVFCIATSRVVLTTQMAVDVVESKGVGIAQLFRHFKILPRCTLTDAGVLDGPGGERLWREYVLEGSGIECRIREEYRPDLLTPRTEEDSIVEHKKGAQHLGNSGNLLKGTECSNVLDVDGSKIAHPFQRVLLNAVGNVVRILSSYHWAEISIVVLRSTESREVNGAFERDVLLVCNNKAVCQVRSVVVIEDDNIRDAVTSGECGLGDIFRRFDLVPEFKPQEVELEPMSVPGFGRRYSLSAPGVVCEIQEEFPMAAIRAPDVASSSVPLLEGIPDIYRPSLRPFRAFDEF